MLSAAPYHCRGGVPPRPWVLGLEELAVLLAVIFRLCCCSTPFLWSCPKKRGGAPKKNAYGVVAPP